MPVNIGPLEAALLALAPLLCLATIFFVVVVILLVLLRRGGRPNRALGQPSGEADLPGQEGPIR